MDHLNDDILLKSALGLLDEAEEKRIEDHVKTCDQCRNQRNSMNHQIEIIGSFEPKLDVQAYPLPRARSIPFLPLLKAAAILIIGFMLGYLTSELSQPRAVSVMEQQLITKAPVTTMATYKTAEQVDIGALSF